MTVNSFIPYRPRPVTLNVSSQALNPMQRRAFANFTRFGRATARSGRMARGRVRTLSKRSYTRNTNGILGGDNADTKLIYRKKRMPRKKRKRWASFVRKVNAVDERDLGTRTVLFNSQIQTGSATIEQCSLGLGLYTFRNATRPDLNDLYTIGQLENIANPTASAGITVDSNTKLMFHSAVMDVTLRNTSTKNVEGTPQYTTEAAMELDVYDLYFKRDTQDTTNSYADLTEVLNAYDAKEIGGAGSGINLNDRGATPFELPTSLGRFKIKILKKTKFFIPNGQTVTFQVRNPKRKTIRYGDLDKNIGFNRAGWSIYKLLIYRLVPGCTVGTATGQFQVGLSVGVTRKYMYKIEGANEPRERLITSTQSLGGQA